MLQLVWPTADATSSIATPLFKPLYNKYLEKLQKEELKQFGLRQTNNQFIFTYNDRKNNITCSAYFLM